MSEIAKKTRVLIVDDSSFMRKVLRSIVGADSQMEVVGEAKDGREAVSMSLSLKPDVITMDINMPHVDGLQATEQIMSQNPRPIVIVSSETRDGAASTLVALELGAIDFISKPSSGVDLDMNAVAGDLNRKLKMAAKVRVVRTAARTKPRVPASQAGKAAPVSEKMVPERTTSPGNRFPIVVIAASTGGPAAIMHIAPAFPKDLPAAVVIVQHMPPDFTAQFAVQLASATEMRVREVEQNEALCPGTLYVCPGSHHLRISAEGRMVLDAGERISGYRPCADVTMETATGFAGSLTTGVVLTGMGNDGSRGARAIRAAGGVVFAQDESSSVIFGMPAEAIKGGFVTQVLPLAEIPEAVEKRVRQLAPTAQAVLS